METEDIKQKLYFCAHSSDLFKKFHSVTCEKTPPTSMTLQLLCQLELLSCVLKKKSVWNRLIRTSSDLVELVCLSRVFMFK